MEITCPACRKLNVVASGERDGVCVRCGCELSQPVAIAHAARTALQEANDALGAGEPQTALAHADVSWHLRRSPEAAAACRSDAPALDRWRDRWANLQASA